MTQFNWISVLIFRGFCHISTVNTSDLWINTNLAAADRLSDVAADIGRQLPDFICRLSSRLFPPLPHFFSHITLGLCLLWRDVTVNEISDGGWGKPWPEATRAFQPFLLLDRSDEVRQLVRDEDKRQNKRPTVCSATTRLVIIAWTEAKFTT